jgi:hypothetical protein
MRYDLVVGSIASIALASVALAGDCIQPKASDPHLLALFKKAAGDNPHVSRRFGRAAAFCAEQVPIRIDEKAISERTRNEESYFLFGGDTKCGVIFPLMRSELLSTEELRKEYEDHVRKDVRLWVTSPKGESVILSKPSHAEIRVPQSILDCFEKGPSGFSCPEGPKRQSCCRTHVRRQLGYTLTYPDPFQPGGEIVLTDRADRLYPEAQVTIKRPGQKPKPLYCYDELFY